MSLPVVLTDDAGADFDIAVDRYEQRAGLGVEFIDEVRTVLTRISLTPECTGSFIEGYVGPWSVVFLI